eukprot:TRINITY_DN12511_c1_g2_i3.p2 TRINITY_DN12511_c1_g2~~TRINITY_DN12511_c1_g2_i3.p2  ORF type:complete len:380 (+),score=72.08 TRINITY_DN12511_c1_g2_i3:2682-3821(+)
MPYYKYDPVDNKTLDKPKVTQSHASMPLMGPVDITETKEKLKFVVDVPGLSSKDVHVRVTSDLLQISGQREQYKVEENEQVHRMERSAGRFCRTFRLPPSADHQKVQAHCEHGVLTVIVDKDAELQKKALALADKAAEAEGDGNLNDEFAAVPMSIFPTPALGKIVVLKSDMSILDAVNLLSDNHILSAPVRDVDMPDDTAWTEKYIGILDMIGVVFHMLDVLEQQTNTGEDFKAEIERVQAFRDTTVKDAITFARFGPFIPVDFEKGNLLDCMLLAGHHVSLVVSATLSLSMQCTTPFLPPSPQGAREGCYRIAIERIRSKRKPFASQHPALIVCHDCTGHPTCPCCTSTWRRSCQYHYAICVGPNIVCKLAPLLGKF